MDRGFTTPNPLVTFRPEDVDLTCGTRWKQHHGAELVFRHGVGVLPGAPR